MPSYESRFVQVLISSNHIRLGLPCADLFSSLPSRICSASLPLDPRRTCPAKANFCFLMLLRTCSSVSFIRCITSLLDTLSDHFILSSRQYSVAPVFKHIYSLSQIIIQGPTFIISCLLLLQKVDMPLMYRKDVA